MRSLDYSSPNEAQVHKENLVGEGGLETVQAVCEDE